MTEYREASVGVKVVVILIFFGAALLAGLDKMFVGSGSPFYFPLLMLSAIGFPVVAVVLIEKRLRKPHRDQNKAIGKQ